MKEKKGISLIILIITIAIMSILAISVGYFNNIVENSEFQLIFTNMKLIQTKVKVISEKTNFDGDKTRFIGEKLKDVPNKYEIAGEALTEEELEDENFYIYNQEILNNIGLEGIKLKDDEIYIVNYNTLDSIYPKGCVDFNGQVKRRLSEITINN